MYFLQLFYLSLSPLGLLLCYWLRGKIKDFSDVPSSDGRIHHHQTNTEGIFVKKKMVPHGNQGLPKRMKSIEM